MANTADDASKKERLAVLDQSLLFLSSFLSFFFGVAIFYVYPAGETALSSLGVFVVVTTILPLYVGVMRGGVERRDDLRERVRGWVYLIFGGGFFLVFFVLHQVASPVTPTTPLYTGLFDDAVAFAAIPVMALILGFTIRFVSWSYKTIDGTKPSGQDLSAIYGIMGSTFVSILFFLGIALLGQGFNTYPITDPNQGRVITIVQSFILLLPLVVVEFNCHHEKLLAKADREYQDYAAKNLKPVVVANKSIWTRGWLVLFEVSMRSFLTLLAGVDKKSKFPVYFVVVAFVYVIAETLLLPAYFDLAVLLVVVSEALLYYGIWIYMKGTWSSETGSAS
ncbi:MAG TPA: hypothetical protein VGR56_07155 [Nitrososphaerales archaeon]|nr:hypothetical protein [Nitrososphaerales archaeon]